MKKHLIISALLTCALSNAMEERNQGEQNQPIKHYTLADLYNMANIRQNSTISSIATSSANAQQASNTDSASYSYVPEINTSESASNDDNRNNENSSGNAIVNHDAEHIRQIHQEIGQAMDFEIDQQLNDTMMRHIHNGDSLNNRSFSASLISQTESHTDRVVQSDSNQHTYQRSAEGTQTIFKHATIFIKGMRWQGNGLHVKLKRQKKTYKTTQIGRALPNNDENNNNNNETSEPAETGNNI